jgi:hypothetical protein
MSDRKLKILMTGGGTGGHVFPAIAIADAIKKLRPDTEFLFVGAIGKMEMERVPQAGYAIEGLNIAGISKEHEFEKPLVPVQTVEKPVESQEDCAEVSAGCGDWYWRICQRAGNAGCTTRRHPDADSGAEFLRRGDEQDFRPEKPLGFVWRTITWSSFFHRTKLCSREIRCAQTL